MAPSCGGRRAAAVVVAKLFVAATLPDFDESKPAQNCHHLLRLENWDRHGSGNLDGLDADKLRLKRRLTVLEKHGDYFGHVLLQLIQCRPLGVGTRKTRHVADVHSRFRATFDHYRI
jgi:hypothetical protein